MKTLVIAFTALALLASPAFAKSNAPLVAKVTSRIVALQAHQATILATDPTLSVKSDQSNYDQAQVKVVRQTQHLYNLTH